VVHRAALTTSSWICHELECAYGTPTWSTLMPDSPH